MREKLGTAVGLVLALTPGLASAQTPPPPQSAPTTQSGGTVTPGQNNSPGPNASADPNAPPAPPPGPASPSSYGYTDKSPRASGAVHHVRIRKGAPTATLPGFEQLPDGGSRLFVDLTTQVPVEERRAPGSVTYVLKGAQVTHYNNTNALVTVHFNTPVYRARLVPSGNDLLFVVDLRDANAAPQFKMSAKGQGAILTVDFGGGNYIPADDANGAPDVQPAPNAQRAPSGQAGPSNRPTDTRPPRRH